MKLSVLNIAELYPPGYAGGAAVYVHDTCRHLAARGHDIRVLCTESNDSEPYSVREETIEDVRIFRVNLPYFRDKDPGGWMLSISEWKEHCAKIDVLTEKIFADWTPDIIQYHTPSSLIEECLPAIERRKIPIVGMTHDAWTVCLKTSLFKSPTDTACSGPTTAGCLECNYSYWDGSRIKALAKLPWRIAKLGLYPAYKYRSRMELSQKVAGLICVSKFMAESHAPYVTGVVKHISLGIDLTLLPAEFPKRDHEVIRFGFVAGFVNHKGIWDVLDIVALLKREGYKFELHIWGPKQSEQPLIERGIEDVVKLRGLFKPDEIWDVYAQIDVLLMATRWAEPYGRVVQEAAASGIPTIAPRVGGITEQIRHEVDGLLFKFRDKDDLALQLKKVLERKELLSELAANLQPVVDTRDAVLEMEDYYLKLLKR